MSEIVFKRPSTSGWVELRRTPEGWYARAMIGGQLRENRRPYPSAVSALVTLARGPLDDPAFIAIMQDVRRAAQGDVLPKRRVARHAPLRAVARSDAWS